MHPNNGSVIARTLTCSTKVWAIYMRKQLKTWPKRNMVTGLENLRIEELDFCEGCITGKQHRKPTPVTMKQSNELLELVHADVWGPVSFSAVFRHFYRRQIAENPPICYQIER